MSESVEDLEKLIDMAEKVSVALEYIESKSSEIKARLAFALAILYGGFVLSFVVLSKYREYFDIPDLLFNCMIVISFACALLGVILTFRVGRTLISYRKNKKVESGVLHHLLDMIHEYKSHLLDSNSLSFVELAIIDIRLKRIEYSGGRASGY